MAIQSKSILVAAEYLSSSKTFMQMVVLSMIIVALVGPQTNALSVGEEGLRHPVVKRDNTNGDVGVGGDRSRQGYQHADSKPKAIDKGIRTLGSGGWDIDRRRRRRNVA
jgi:hypothetical protein